MRIRTALCALAFGCALAVTAPGTATAAFDSYLQIEGIEGESNRIGYEGAIEVLSFSLGGSKVSNKPVQFSSLNLMKRTESSTPLLTQAMATGQTIPWAKLSLIKAGGDAPKSFMRYCLTGVRVEGMQWSGSAGGDDTPIENVSLGYDTIVQAYQRTQKDGTLAPPLFAGWDLVNKLQFGDKSC